MTGQQAIYAGDPCYIDPTSPMCGETYDPPAPPSTNSTPTIDTTYRRIDYAGWQFTGSAPYPIGAVSSSTTDDKLASSLTGTRTTSAADSKLAYGEATVRAYTAPGGTITMTCNEDADCWPSHQPHSTVSLDGGTDPDGPVGSWLHCGKV